MNRLTIRSVCIVALVAGGLSSLVTGCASTSGIEVTGKVIKNDSGPEINKSIVFNNRGLAGDIEITDMRSSFSEDILKIQISLRSNNRDTVPLQYLFVWFDAKGFEISSNKAWTPFLVYGKETTTIHGVAPDPRVKEFKLKLRDPDVPY